jgi:hypothetical protein
MSTEQDKPGPPAYPRAKNMLAPEELGDRECLARLLTAIERSNRRWQIVMFPSLLAFLVLAFYGFYIIVSLVSDIDRMANTVDTYMGAVSDRMTQVSMNLDELTGSVRNISVNLDELTGTVRSMEDTVAVIATNTETMTPMLGTMAAINNNMETMNIRIDTIAGNVDRMNQQMYAMTNVMGNMSVATRHINHSVAGMNQSFGRPLSFMNSFMPW